tara:strand:- start:360 stop:1274 length:915 start_codon:yes stop_codon:yes gene_type:complete
MIKKIFNKLIYIFQIKYINFIYFSVEKIGSTNHSVSSKLNHYIYIVNKLYKSDRLFKNFKRSVLYKEVLEHVTYSLAEKYLTALKEDYPEFLNEANLSLALENDKVGNPEIFNFKIQTINEEKNDKKNLMISGPSLRYLFVYCHIYQNLQLKIDTDFIAEIGGGYGGQALIFDRFMDYKRYTIFDLPSVNKLSKKYLNSYYLNNSFETMDINEFEGSKKFDLVISNYAFSELPRELQKIYLNKVILNSKSGYMTMNTGNDLDFKTKTSKYRASELLKLIKNSKIIQENPITSEKNYILIWGDNI